MMAITRAFPEVDPPAAVVSTSYCDRPETNVLRVRVS